MEADLVTRLITEYQYVIIVPAVFLLGPIVSLVAGVLLRLDVIQLVPTSLALAVGELGSDVLWYWIGRRYGESFVRRFGAYVGITETSVRYVQGLFSKHHDLIIFSSKLTAGFGFALVVLFTAGLTKAPFGRYMMLNIVGQFLWTAMLLSIGYFLGHIYLRVGDVFEKIALLALIAIIVVSLAGFARYMRGMLDERQAR
ncbi:MAG: VTT domain-containing protein [Patescibacteria group bacterium]